MRSISDSLWKTWPKTAGNARLKPKEASELNFVDVQLKPSVYRNTLMPQLTRNAGAAWKCLENTPTLYFPWHVFIYYISWTKKNQIYLDENQSKGIWERRWRSTSSQRPWSSASQAIHSSQQVSPWTQVSAFVSNTAVLVLTHSWFLLHGPKMDGWSEWANNN